MPLAGGQRRRCAERLSGACRCGASPWRAGFAARGRAAAHDRRASRPGARCVDHMRRPHARSVAEAGMRHVPAPAAWACSDNTACACAALACVAMLGARCVCAAPLSGPTCMVATTARSRPPRLRTRPVCGRSAQPCLARSHPASTRPARSRLARRPHVAIQCIACNVRTCELALCVQALRVLTSCVRVRRAGTGISTRAAPQRAPRACALREDHIAVLLAMCAILPCARKRCARLCSASGCAVLGQVLAPVHLDVALLQLVHGL